MISFKKTTTQHCLPETCKTEGPFDMCQGIAHNKYLSYRTFFLSCRLFVRQWTTQSKQNNVKFTAKPFLIILIIKNGGNGGEVCANDNDDNNHGFKLQSTTAMSRHFE